jgi:hypothetical protein
MRTAALGAAGSGWACGSGTKRPGDDSGGTPPCGTGAGIGNVGPPETGGPP